MNKRYNHINKDINNEFLNVYELLLGVTHFQSPIGNGLQPTLELKQNNLISQTNIKSINNESILGKGNLVISGTGGTGSSYFPSGW